MQNSTLATPVLALTLCAFAAACSGGGSSDSSSSPPASTSASADVVLVPTPVDGLDYLRTEIASLRPVRGDGSAGVEMLSGPFAVELVGLDGTAAWMSRTEVEADTWTALRLSFDPTAHEAAASDGTDLVVDAPMSVVELPLESPWTPAGQSHARLEIELDLTTSVEVDAGAGVVRFDPAGSVRVGDGDPDVPIDELKGIVLSVDEPAGELVVDAFADGDALVPLGEVTVTLAPDALLLDEDGSAFADPAAFFAALLPGATFLEVHGVLSEGAVEAARIEIEDQSGGQSSLGIVELEGTVLDVDLAAELLVLEVREIEKGVLVALPILAGLPDPDEIDVSLALPPVVVLEATSELGSLSDLAVGQEVDVTFGAFLDEPFPATVIEIDGEGSGFGKLRGVVTDDSDLPDSFEMALLPGEPAVAAGLVDDTATSVTVGLEAATPWLDTKGHPSLADGDLIVGLRVDVCGTLTGPPNDPAVAATDVRVRAGRIDKTTATVPMPSEPSFDALGGVPKFPFGGDVVPGAIDARIEPGAVYTGDTKSTAEFFALFDGLEADERVEVRIQGIATDVPDQVRAFELFAKVRKD